MNLTTNYQFKFSEVIALQYPSAVLMNLPSLKDVCIAYNVGVSFTENLITNTDIDLTSSLYVKLWNEVYTTYHDHYCISRNEDSLSITDEEVIMLFRYFIIIILKTHDIYSTILNVYQENIANLMADVSSSSSSKSNFNDTPQNDGTYDDDLHATNLTKVTTNATSQMATKMARIKEIQENFRNLLAQWVNEFDVFWED